MHENSYEAYIVGGAVRDSLLCNKVSDYDITTSAFPDEMRYVFRNYKVFDTGIKHGTLTVRSCGHSVEITTFRQDGEYLDNRRPKEVTFSRNLSDDLSRRDFTVNAMAYKEGKLVDLFGGMDDLEKGIIRCVGDAEKRFEEDGLRIMRALRFASQLGFEIEPSTADAIHRKYLLLENISVERISSELVKIITGRNASKIIGSYHEVFSYIMHGVRYECLDRLTGDFITRLAILISNDSHQILRRLKFDNKTISCVDALVKYRDKILPCDRAYVKRLLSEISYENFKRLSEVKRCPDLLAIADSVEEKGECYRISQLNINGRDIISNGIAKGADIGKLLDTLLDDVIDGRCENEKEKLMQRAKAYIKR